MFYNTARTVKIVFWPFIVLGPLIWWLVSRIAIGLYEYLSIPFVESGQARKLKRDLQNATTYNEWISAACKLDNIIRKLHDWKYNPKDSEYGYQNVQVNMRLIQEAVEAEDAHRIKQLLHPAVRHGPFNIGKSQLFDKLYGGTKLLVEQYIDVVMQSLHSLTGLWYRDLTPQRRMENLILLRKSARRTALNLQGGSILPIYQLGVVKGLVERDVLPKLIVGTGTGAVVAALIAPLTDVELEVFLSDPVDNILEAFEWTGDMLNGDQALRLRNACSRGLLTRAQEFWDCGFIFDRDSLQRLIDTRLNDMTFEDARKRSGRDVCITIAADSPGTPSLLCYTTTPNVLIRSAVKAAMLSDFDQAMNAVLEKDSEGAVQKWSLNDETPAFKERRRKKDRKGGKASLLYQDRALDRANQIFDVDHYITSQARMFAIPFTGRVFNRSQAPLLFPYAQFFFKTWFARVLLSEVRFFMKWTWTPMWIQKLLMDTKTSRDAITITPDIGLKEIRYLMRNADRENIKHWILLGEKSVWPCVAAIQVRCRAEFALQKYADQMQQESRKAWFLARRVCR